MLVNHDHQSPPQWHSIHLAEVCQWYCPASPLQQPCAPNKLKHTSGRQHGCANGPDSKGVDAVARLLPLVKHFTTWDVHSQQVGLLYIIQEERGQHKLAFCFLVGGLP